MLLITLSLGTSPAAPECWLSIALMEKTMEYIFKNDRFIFNTMIKEGESLTDRSRGFH